MKPVSLVLLTVLPSVWSDFSRVRAAEVAKLESVGRAALSSAHEVAGIQPAVRSRCQSSGWAFDSEPFVDRLLAGREMEVLQAEGPGIVKYLHISHNNLWRAAATPLLAAEAARGVVLLIYYNGANQPSVQVPLGDFFCDGGALAKNFSTYFIEKGIGESYNCWIPMPFDRSIRIVLRNDLSRDLKCVTVAEYDRLPERQPSLGYFHATWQRKSFQLVTDTPVKLFHVDGLGHIFGRYWQITTDDPVLEQFQWIMEANQEVRVDGPNPPPPGPYAKGNTPSYNYTGSEDSFGFSWGFAEPFIGQYHGVNLLQQGREKRPQILGIYDLRRANPIRFNRSVDWTLNWACETTNDLWPGDKAWGEGVRKQLAERLQKGGAWVDYAMTWYWYQKEPGYPHEPLPALAQRAARMLHGEKVAIGPDGKTAGNP